MIKLFGISAIAVSLSAGCGIAVRELRAGQPLVHNCVASSDRRSGAIVVNQSSPDFSRTNVLMTRPRLGGWTEAELLPFSRGTESGGSLSADGVSMLLTSKRPSAFGDQWNLWMTHRSAAGWSAIEPLPVPVNSGEAECCGAFSTAGLFYFSSTRDGSWDIFSATSSSSGSYAVERLPGAVNSGEAGTAPDESGRNGDWPSFADPAGRFLLFSSIRPGGIGGDDIYLALRRDRQWQPAVNLGPLINTDGYEDCASISVDGRRLIWSSRATTRGALSAIKSIPLANMIAFAEILEKSDRERR